MKEMAHRSIPVKYRKQQTFSKMQMSTSSTNNNNNKDNKPSNQIMTEFASYMETSISGYKAPTVNWYPGHIAKAERTLSETLTSADVLLEVRDARIPKATSHPRVREWTVGKPRIVVMTRLDTVPKSSVRSWSEALETLGAGRWDQFIQDGNLRHQARQNLVTRGIEGEDGIVEDVIYVDAKRGGGTPALLRSIGKAGAYVNLRRKSRGLRDRPLRVAVLGYPNVGKSALINRILGRKRAKSANTPGITRSLQWIRVRGDHEGTDVNGKTKKTKSTQNKGMRAGDFELLDSPGIIPANMANQEDAILLAICNSIGNAAYDNQGVAAYLCERLKTLYLMEEEQMTAPVWRKKSIERYGFDPLEPMVIPSLDGNEATRLPTGEDMLFKVAANTCMGDPENAARKILQDFRKGRMGPICLQLAPQIKNEDESFDEDTGERQVDVRREVKLMGENVSFSDGDNASSYTDSDEQRQARAEIAMRAAKERGLELPPMVEEQLNADSPDQGSNAEEAEVGKGLFDGW